MRTAAALALLGSVLLGAFAQDVAMPMGWFRSTRPSTGTTTGTGAGVSGLPGPSSGPSSGPFSGGSGGLSSGLDHDVNRNINDFDRFSSNNNNNNGRSDFRGQFTVKIFGEALVPLPLGHVDSARGVQEATAQGGYLWPLQSIFVSAVGLLCVDNFNGCSMELIVNVGGLQKFVVRTSDCSVRAGNSGQGFLDARLKLVKGDDDAFRDAFPRHIVATFVANSMNELSFEINGCHNGWEGHASAAASDSCYNNGGSRYGKCKVAVGMGPVDMDDMIPVSLIGTATRQGEGFGRKFKNNNNNNDHNNNNNNNNNNNPWGGSGLGGLGSGNNNNNNNNNDHNINNAEDERCQNFPQFQLGLKIVPERSYD